MDCCFGHGKNNESVYNALDSGLLAFWRHMASIPAGFAGTGLVKYPESPGQK
ncbi:hypothetical protein BRYFOR_08347 [Marvinbryantia formatexigens DSM 14469]|uniref:Uncharacterized protein n=1 Tax=Marvinbryantia formatexigens DSM 14469 TaxID=478749 RepID=C6LI76_9FIRM|nr:hypothetical protein BRYFOR_08347 [Marvinbryantia formatexigens DSM 14469]